MNKFMIGASLSAAVFLVLLASGALIANSQQVASVAKPFIDLQSTEQWAIGIALLLGAVASAVAGVFFAWRDHRGTHA